MTARDRFTLTRKYIIELNAIMARLSEAGDEWRPERIKTSEISDPTANQAVYNVDVLGDVIAQMRAREKELQSLSTPRFLTSDTLTDSDGMTCG